MSSTARHKKTFSRSGERGCVQTRFFPSSTSHVPPLLTEINTVMEIAGWKNKDRFAVQMAIVEAFTNACMHGNRNHLSKQVVVCWRLTGDRFFLSIQDEGKGFRPESVPSPCDPENILKASGRGVFLIKSLMDFVHYNDVGNKVVMIKNRTMESELQDE